MTTNGAWKEGYAKNCGRSFVDHALIQLKMKRKNGERREKNVTATFPHYRWDTFGLLKPHQASFE
jgi:hypothetical protein